MANVGRRPTVAAPDSPLVTEVHIFGFSSDLYGKNLRLTFHGRIRDEVKFEDTEALREQIEKDATAARNLLAHSPFAD